MNFKTLVPCVLIVIGAFLLWEFIAWFTHKYVMHGFLWRWHKSHHTVHAHTFEPNDLFVLMFSAPCIRLFYDAALINYNPYLIAVGIGTFCYGAFYLVFHDIIEHQRIKWRFDKKSKYFQRLIHAHYIHHYKHAKDGCEAFDFLIAPKRYQPKQFVEKLTRQETQ